MNTDFLEAWRCPECSQVSYYWHFNAPDGTGLVAELPSLPDMSALGNAKAKALVDHAEKDASDA